MQNMNIHNVKLAAANSVLNSNMIVPSIILRKVLEITIDLRRNYSSVVKNTESRSQITNIVNKSNFIKYMCCC